MNINLLLLTSLLSPAFGMYAMQNNAPQYDQESMQSSAKKRKTGERTCVDAALDNLNKQIKDTEVDFSKLMRMKKIAAMQARVQAELYRRQTIEHVQSWQEKVKQEIQKRAQPDLCSASPIITPDPIVHRLNMAYSPSSLPVQSHSILISPESMAVIPVMQANAILETAKIISLADEIVALRKANVPAAAAASSSMPASVISAVPHINRVQVSAIAAVSQAILPDQDDEIYE